MHRGLIGVNPKSVRSIQQSADLANAGEVRDDPLCLCDNQDVARGEAARRRQHLERSDVFAHLPSRMSSARVANARAVRAKRRRAEEQESPPVQCPRSHAVEFA